MKLFGNGANWRCQLDYHFICRLLGIVGHQRPYHRVLLLDNEPSVCLPCSGTSLRGVRRLLWFLLNVLMSGNFILYGWVRMKNLLKAHIECRISPPLHGVFEIDP
jgi:hypothetical protein